MNGRSAVLEIYRSLKDFLFPPVCPSCESAMTTGGIICPDCIESFTERAFQYTAPPRAMEHVAGFVILLHYDGSCRRIIHSLKYHGMPSIGLVMGELLARESHSAESCQRKRASRSGSSPSRPVK